MMSTATMGKSAGCSWIAVMSSEEHEAIWWTLDAGTPRQARRAQPGRRRGACDTSGDLYQFIVFHNKKQSVFQNNCAMVWRHARLR